MENQVTCRQEISKVGKRKKLKNKKGEGKKKRKRSRNEGGGGWGADFILSYSCITETNTDASDIFTSFSDNIVMADMQPYVSFYGFS